MPEDKGATVESKSAYPNKKDGFLKEPKEGLGQGAEKNSDIFAGLQQQISEFQGGYNIVNVLKLSESNSDPNLARWQENILGDKSEKADGKLESSESENDVGGAPGSRVSTSLSGDEEKEFSKEAASVSLEPVGSVLSEDEEVDAVSASAVVDETESSSLKLDGKGSLAKKDNSTVGLLRDRMMKWNVRDRWRIKNNVEIKWEDKEFLGIAITDKDEVRYLGRGQISDENRMEYANLVPIKNDVFQNMLDMAFEELDKIFYMDKLLDDTRKDLNKNGINALAFLQSFFDKPDFDKPNIEKFNNLDGNGETKFKKKFNKSVKLLCDLLESTEKGLLKPTENKEKPLKPHTLSRSSTTPGEKTKRYEPDLKAAPGKSALRRKGGKSQRNITWRYSTGAYGSGSFGGQQQIEGKGVRLSESAESIQGEHKNRKAKQRPSSVNYSASVGSVQEFAATHAKRKRSANAFTKAAQAARKAFAGRFSPSSSPRER